MESIVEVTAQELISKFKSRNDLYLIASQESMFVANLTMVI